MTLTVLELLKRGETVLWDVPAGHPRAGKVKPLAGRVNAKDNQSVEIFWDDGTSSVLWFQHAADGRETRHLHWRLDPKAHTELY